MSYVDGAVKFELERVRKYGVRESDGYFDDCPYGDTWKPRKETVLAESFDYDIIYAKSQKVSARSGKTFYDEVKINHVDEHGDILHVEIVKDGKTKEKFPERFITQDGGAY